MKPMTGDKEMHLGASTRRARAGKSAQMNGKRFELLFESNCKFRDVMCSRIPDGCRQLGPNKIMRVKTPFDYVASYNGKAAVLDTKSFKQTRFMPSNIEAHQFEALFGHEMQGLRAGYVVEFHPSKRIVFVPASEMLLILQSGEGKPEHEFIQLGYEYNFDVRKIFE